MTEFISNYRSSSIKRKHPFNQCSRRYNVDMVSVETSIKLSAELIVNRMRISTLVKRRTLAVQVNVSQWAAKSTVAQDDVQCVTIK